MTNANKRKLLNEHGTLLEEWSDGGYWAYLQCKTLYAGSGTTAINALNDLFTSVREELFARTQEV